MYHVLAVLTGFTFNPYMVRGESSNWPKGKVFPPKRAGLRASSHGSKAWWVELFWLSSRN